MKRENVLEIANSFSACAVNTERRPNTVRKLSTNSRYAILSDTLHDLHAEITLHYQSYFAIAPISKDSS